MNGFITYFIVFVLISFSTLIKANNLVLAVETPNTEGAISVVRMNTTSQIDDVSNEYKTKVLTQALQKTVQSHGSYIVHDIKLFTTNVRAISEVQSGENINLFIGVTTREWEETNIPIRIPIRRGILNHRVLAINKKNVNKFSKVSNISQLKKLASGVRVGWATTDVFKKQAFTLYELVSIDGLYNMLERNAIDYIPRGINEIYDEITLRQSKNLMVEPSLVLYLPAPSYIFVSPNEPKLAQRIEEGLEKMLSDGSLKALFYAFYADEIEKADISNRRMIYVPNPDSPKSIPFDRPELWFINDVK
jgi:hypothetical protein